MGSRTNRPNPRIRRSTAEIPLGHRGPDQTAVWSSYSFFDAFNLNHYSNHQVDELLDKAVASGDTEERKQLYGQDQDIVMEELPSLPLLFPNVTVAVSKKLNMENYSPLPKLGEEPGAAEITLLSRPGQPAPGGGRYRSE